MLMTLDHFYGGAGELFSFYRIPKALFLESRFQNLSTDAKTLYGILLDRMSLSVKNGWLDEQGRVFIVYTIEDVNGKQKEYEERTKAKQKAEIEARKQAIRTEDIARGVFIPVSSLPQLGPRKGA